MEFLHFATLNPFDAIGYIAVVATLLFTAVELRQAKVELRHLQKSQQVGNLIANTREHREIWSLYLSTPTVSRVLDRNANLVKTPLSSHELIFVNLLILHLNSTFQAAKADMLVPPQRLRDDIRNLFSLPVPRAAWQKSRAVQDEDFVQFVEAAIRS